ncbi:MAG: deoxyribose-phosphate aldolase [Chloroflexi bacterium]|nr:deoxyribose-phosphate aldolase [Chloroflexota bacterium]
MDFTYAQIASMLVHGLVNPVLTDTDLEHGCHVAMRYNISGVAIKPFFVLRAVELFAGKDQKVGTVVGFPHGSDSIAIKEREASEALRDGAQEIDMVVNIGKVLSEDWPYVISEVNTITQSVHSAGGIVKVTFENCYLHNTHIIKLCEICGEAGVDYVKTSTGYGTSGAVEDDLVLMRRHSPPQTKIKAASGVRTLDRVLELRMLEVDRIGTTATMAILEEAKRRLNA